MGTWVVLDGQRDLECNVSGFRTKPGEAFSKAAGAGKKINALKGSGTRSDRKG